METKDIVIMAACFVLAGFSIYRKYVAKKNASGDNKGAASSMPSIKDEDYEPYSGK